MKRSTLTTIIHASRVLHRAVVRVASPLSPTDVALLFEIKQIEEETSENEVVVTQTLLQERIGRNLSGPLFALRDQRLISTETRAAVKGSSRAIIELTTPGEASAADFRRRFRAFSSNLMDRCGCSGITFRRRVEKLLGRVSISPVLALGLVLNTKLLNAIHVVKASLVDSIEKSNDAWVGSHVGIVTRMTLVEAARFYDGLTGVVRIGDGYWQLSSNGLLTQNGITQAGQDFITNMKREVGKVVDAVQGVSLFGMLQKISRMETAIAPADAARAKVLR